MLFSADCLPRFVPTNANGTSVNEAARQAALFATSNGLPPQHSQKMSFLSQQQHYHQPQHQQQQQQQLFGTQQQPPLQMRYNQVPLSSSYDLGASQALQMLQSQTHAHPPTMTIMQVQAPMPVKVPTSTLHVAYNPRLTDRGDMFLHFRGFDGFDLIAFYDKFCFVRFRDPDSAARVLAMPPLNGVTTYDAAKQSYEVPYPQPEDGRVPCKVLHVTHLPTSYTKQEMAKIFGIFEGFLEAHFYGKYGYAYFTSERAAAQSRNILRHETNLVVSFAKNAPKPLNDVKTGHHDMPRDAGQPSLEIFGLYSKHASLLQMRASNEGLDIPNPRGVWPATQPDPYSVGTPYGYPELAARSFFNPTPGAGRRPSSLPGSSFEEGFHMLESPVARGAATREELPPWVLAGVDPNSADIVEECFSAACNQYLEECKALVCTTPPFFEMQDLSTSPPNLWVSTLDQSKPDMDLSPCDFFPCSSPAAEAMMDSTLGGMVTAKSPYDLSPQGYFDHPIPSPDPDGTPLMTHILLPTTPTSSRVTPATATPSDPVSPTSSSLNQMSSFLTSKQDVVGWHPLLSHATLDFGLCE